MSGHVRWMVRRDMPEVLEIDGGVWTDEDFIRCLRQQNCIGRVVEVDDGMLVGFMVYELFKTRYELRRFDGTAVAWKALADDLYMKLKTNRRNNVLWWVPEGDLELQVFLRGEGWLAVDTKKGYYQMELRLNVPELERMP